MNPPKTKAKTSIASKLSKDSGNKWKKAPLSKAPAENATRTKTTLFKVFSLTHNEKTPAKETKPSIKVARIIHSKTYIYTQPSIIAKPSKNMIIPDIKCKYFIFLSFQPATFSTVVKPAYINRVIPIIGKIKIRL